MKRRTVMQAIGAGIAAAGFPSIAAAKTAPFDFEKRTVRLNDGHDMPIIRKRLHRGAAKRLPPDRHGARLQQ